VEFGVIDQLLINAFVRFWGKKIENTIGYQLSLDFKIAYDSVRREELYIILTEFVILMKLG